MLTKVCTPPPTVYYGCLDGCGYSCFDPWLYLWALLTLLIVLGTALSVLSATRRLSRVERRMHRHFDNLTSSTQIDRSKAK